MNNLFIFFLEAPLEEPTATFGIFWWILYILLIIAPWAFVLFKFVIFRKLRVRFILPNKEELPSISLKKGAHIDLPEAPSFKNYTFVGWYIDENLTEEWIDVPMPNKNIKLYAKYERLELEGE